jgi:hypothetical protein
MTNTTAIAFMKPGVPIVSSGGAAVTTLDGELARHGLVGADLGSVEIRGITFEDCRATGTGGLASFTGSGVMILRSSPTVRENVFRRCLALGDGGASGLYLIEASGGVVTHNLFVDNIAGDIGGGAGILQCVGTTIENNTFVRNLAMDGGGAIEINLSQIAFSNNVLAHNVADTQGGGLLCLGGSTTTGGCNLFWANAAPAGGHVAGPCLVVGSDDNLVADPLFCDSGDDDFSVRSDSPAAPGHPSGCGPRGAFGVGCGPVGVEASSWGKIKSRYRVLDAGN